MSKTGLPSWKYGFRFPQNRFLLAVLILACCSTAYTSISWHNAFVEAHKQQSNVTRMTDQVRDKMRLKQLEQAVNEATGELSVWESRFKQRISQATLVEELDTLAQRDGINIISEDFEKPITADNQTLLILDLSLEADYKAIRQFLSHLDTLPALFVLNELSLTRPRSASQQVQARLRISFYNNLSDNSGGKQ